MIVFLLFKINEKIGIKKTRYKKYNALRETIKPNKVNKNTNFDLSKFLFKKNSRISIINISINICADLSVPCSDIL